MTDPEYVIPRDRLPEGFAERVEQPVPHPAPPRPAATIVLMREARPGLQILLLRRARSSGFVPGAWVFPGGRVDTADGVSRVADRLLGPDAATAASRLGMSSDAEPTPLAYYVAALREAFEETGLLVGRALDAHRGHPPGAGDLRVSALRKALMADEVTFSEVLDALGCRGGGAVEYIAHWITPVVEPRRYDTRFFAASVPEGSEPVLDPREMTHALWLTPAEALARYRDGALPMVFPTIKTLESLTAFRSPAQALAAFAAREIPAILPRLVTTPTGIGLELP